MRISSHPHFYHSRAPVSSLLCVISMQISSESSSTRCLYVSVSGLASTTLPGRWFTSLAKSYYGPCT